jgi:DNA-binding CsgD family transcriptional regulator/PAS domain-containing protein
MPPPTGEEDQVIAAFYQAAHGISGWHGALQRMTEYLDCFMVQLVGIDLQQQRLTYSFEGGAHTAEGIVEYARKYHRMDPHLQQVMALPPGRMLHMHELFDEAYVAQSPFYQDFLIPYGSRFVHGGKLHETEHSAVLLGIHRDPVAGPLHGEGRARAERLFYHLGQAVQLYSRQLAPKAEAAIGRATLDRLGSPVLLLDEQRRIRLCNEAAERLLARGDPLRNHGGLLHCTHAASSDAFTLALRSLHLAGPPGAGEGAPQDRAVVRVPMPGQLLPMSLCLLAIRPDHTLGAFGERASAMLLVHDPASRPRFDPFLLGAVLDLTPAESRVATGLASGLSPVQIATEHAVSVHTVRTQIRTIYKKLGVRHLAELLLLVNASPLLAFKE